MISNKERRKLRKQLRFQGFKVYSTRKRAVIKARGMKFFTGQTSWVEKQGAGFIVWNNYLLKRVNKELMARGAQKIRQRDIKKTIIFKIN